MPLYKFKAVDAQGRAVYGNFRGRDPLDIKRKINEKGLTAVRIQAGSGLREMLSRATAPKLNPKSITLFCRQLHIIVSSGVNILNGLDILRNQTQDKPLKLVVDRLFNEVQKGRSLSEAMAEIEISMPPLLVNMISVGETSGNLDDILRNMAVYYEKDNFVREKLKSAMTYPIILSLAGTGMMVFFINFVLPEIMKVVQGNGAELPMITRVVMASVNFLQNYFIWIAVILAAAALSIWLLVPRSILRLLRDRLVLRLPVISTGIRNVVTSRFMRTTSMMLRGGIPLLFVLESVEKVLGNAVAENGVRAAMEGVKRGERLGANIASCGFFDPMVPHMIDIGEETGQLDHIMDTMADFYDREAEAGLMKMMAMIEPLFTLIIGVVIGILIISMMIPMFGMMSQFGT